MHCLQTSEPFHMLFSLLTILLLSLLLFRLDVTHPMTRLGSAVPCWSPTRVPIPLCSKCLLVSLWISGSLKSGTICILLTVASLLYAQYMVWSKAVLVEWHDHKFVIIKFRSSWLLCCFRAQEADNIYMIKWLLMHVSILHVLLMQDPLFKWIHLMLEIKL